MDVTEIAYKIIVGYAGKKNVVKLFVAKKPEDLERLEEIRAVHESDPDALFVQVVRTRKPRSYNYDHYETRVMVDDSGTVTTPGEKSLLFGPAAKKQAMSYTRSDQEKVAWARNNTFDNRTCTWH